MKNVIVLNAWCELKQKREGKGVLGRVKGAQNPLVRPSNWN